MTSAIRNTLVALCNFFQVQCNEILSETAEYSTGSDPTDPTMIRIIIPSYLFPWANREMRR